MRLMLSMAAAAVAIASVPAGASVVTYATGGASFATTPFVHDFGGGNTLTVSNTGDFFSPEAVATGGDLQVGSFGAPFYNPPQPTAYFTNRGGSFGPGANIPPIFQSYSTPAPVAYSISEGLVGFRFDLGNGLQYGYVDTVGTSIRGFRFETTPGADVPFGAVPEPASWGLMIAGFALTGVASRRRVAHAA